MVRRHALTDIISATLNWRIQNGDVRWQQDGRARTRLNMRLTPSTSTPGDRSIDKFTAAQDSVWSIQRYMILCVPHDQTRFESTLSFWYHINIYVAALESALFMQDPPFSKDYDKRVIAWVGMWFLAEKENEWICPRIGRQRKNSPKMVKFTFGPTPTKKSHSSGSLRPATLLPWKQTTHNDRNWS